MSSLNYSTPIKLNNYYEALSVLENDLEINGNLTVDQNITGSQVNTNILDASNAIITNLQVDQSFNSLSITSTQLNAQDATITNLEVGHINHLAIREHDQTQNRKIVDSGYDLLAVGSPSGSTWASIQSFIEGLGYRPEFLYPISFLPQENPLSTTLDNPMILVEVYIR